MIFRIFLALWLFYAPAFAQVGQIPGWPPLQIAGNLNCATGGPGDCISNASFYIGVRCYQNAYSGKVMEIWDAATGSTSNTTASCSGGTVSYSTTTGCTAGGATCQPLATTCLVSCNVAELYDQSGNSNCSGPCNFVQATNSARPIFTQSCFGSLPCLTATSANSQTMLVSASASTGSTGTQSLATVFNRATGQGNNVLLYDGENYLNQLFTDNSMNLILAFGAVNYTVTAADGVSHSYIMTSNIAAGTAQVVDGVATTNANNSSASFGGALKLFAAGNYWQGNWGELGLWDGNTFSASQYGKLCHNERLAFGTTGTC